MAAQSDPTGFSTLGYLLDFSDPVLHLDVLSLFLGDLFPEPGVLSEQILVGDFLHILYLIIIQKRAYIPALIPLFHRTPNPD